MHMRIEVFEPVLFWMRCCCIALVILTSAVFVRSIKSVVWGTAISAAPVGVAALISATKSLMVKSVSCPTAEMIGMLEAKIARATLSSLNAHSSSIDPPPLPTINTSHACFSFASSMRLTIDLLAFSP